MKSMVKLLQKIISLTLLIALLSCGAIVNHKLEKIGAYDEKIKLTKVTTPEKDIIFFPMIHLSTENFYADVKNKIDSPKKKLLFFL